MLGPDRSWTVRGRAYPLIAASRLAKGEQPVNVAAHNPMTTTEAARNRRDRRAESMTCTSILIQKSNQPAQLDDEPGLSSLSSLFGLFGLSGVSQTNSIDQTNQTNQIDETDRIDQESRR